MEIWKELLKLGFDFVFVFIAWWVFDKIKSQGYKQGYQDGLHDRAKWEYKIEQPPRRNIEELQKILDEYSQDGWELHFQDVKEGWWDFIFKRKIED